MPPCPRVGASGALTHFRRNDRLCVWGENRFDSETHNANDHLLQCAFGSFHLDLALPQPVDTERGTASYRNGVLRIELPRLERGHGQRIAVHGG